MSDEETTVNETTVDETTTETVSTFTQAEVEAIVEKRLARERKSKGDYDELKTKAEQFDVLQAEQKSELEKLLERAEAAEKQRDDVAAQAAEQAVRSAVIAEASRQGAIDPEDVVKLIDRDSLTDEAGEISGIDAAVTALLEAKPHLATSRTPGPGDGGARTGPSDEKSDPALALGQHILKAAGR